MRVVHVVTAFPRSPNDVITPWMVDLLRRSRDRGMEADVLAPAYRGSGNQVVEGIPVRRFRYAPATWETLTHEETAPDRVRRSPAHAALVPLYLAGGAAAAWKMGREAPDVVHVHWPVPHALFGAAARAASGGRTALVCSFYAVGVNWVRHRLPWLRPFLRWSARTADAVTAVSTSTARSVREVAGRDAEVIPFAASVGTAPEGEARDEPGRPAPRTPLSGPGPLRLLFVGRLVERKGVEVLVRALARIVERRPARLVVVGEGPREGRIRETAREAGVADVVELTGYLSDEDLSRQYGTCDIFVLPAVVDRKGDTEGLGVVLLEALRYERPVVASRLGGIPDIVEDGVTGWLAPPADPDALARTILRVAERPEESRQVARRGRRIVEDRFSWERILDDLEACYRDARATREEPAAGGGSDRYRTFVESETYRRQRMEKARVIARICGRELRASERIADLGAGTGIVKKELETIIGNRIVGFELDRSFMEVGERMAVADVTRLPLEDGGLDFAVLNHLYEHVEDQPGLFRELHRVLAPGGAAYVSAGSRWAVMEPHYRLPFLSWLPRRLADLYLRITGRGEAYRDIRFLGYGRLTGMMRDAGFQVEDRTLPAIDDLLADTWGRSWDRLWRAVRALPDRAVEAVLRSLSPQWFFLLHKPGAGRRDA